MTTPCGYILPREHSYCGVEHDPCASACLLPDRHDGLHLFKNPAGIYYVWGTDYECDCEDCMSDEPDNWCLVFGDVEKDTAEERLATEWKKRNGKREKE